MQFFSKYKNIFIIIGFVGIVLFLGYLLYYLFFKQMPAAREPANTEPAATSSTSTGFPASKTGTGNKANPNQGGNLPSGQASGEGSKASDIAQGGVTVVSEVTQAPSMSAALNGDGKTVQYYSKNDGKFYKLDEEGNMITLSDKIFPEAQKVTWSPDANKAVIEFPDESKVVYDFNSKKQVTLPKHWQDFDFSPGSDKLVSKSVGQDPNNRWLIISESDGSKAQAIESLGENGDYLIDSWSPNNQSIALMQEGVNLDRQEIYFIGMNHENFKALTVEGRGFAGKWAPKGDRLLYSVYSSETDLKPNLWVAGAEGENIGSSRKNLGIETFADKCTFEDNENAYCGVPVQLENGSGLMPELASITNDNIYKINISTGSKKLIAIPEGSYTISNIIIADYGGSLYFTDKGTGKIFKINLK